MGEFARLLQVSKTAAVPLQLLQTVSIMIQNLKNEHAICELITSMFKYLLGGSFYHFLVSNLGSSQFNSILICRLSIQQRAYKLPHHLFVRFSKWRASVILHVLFKVLSPLYPSILRLRGFKLYHHANIQVLENHHFFNYLFCFFIL